jgi:hypothetical protein
MEPQQTLDLEITAGRQTGAQRNMVSSSSSSTDLKPRLDLFVFVSTARTETGDELP